MAILVKIYKFFPLLCILRPHWRGSPWNWVASLWSKNTRMMGLAGRERSLTIFSAVWTVDTMHQHDRQTDSGQQQRPQRRTVKKNHRKFIVEHKILRLKTTVTYMLLLVNPGSPGKWPLKRRQTDRERERENTGSTAIFQDNPGGPVPECLHSGFYWSYGWWRWWWQLCYKKCKAPVNSSPPTNLHPALYRPDALPGTQPTMSEHWREKYHIPGTCLPWSL